MNLGEIDVNKLHNVGLTKGQDPDKLSVSLKEYHMCLFSNRKMQSCSFTIKAGQKNEIIFNNKEHEIIFTPDSITNIFESSSRWFNKMREKDIVASFVDEDHEVATLVNEFHRIDYSIGSSIIFPIRFDGMTIKTSLNCGRGMSQRIHDRIDYTLECIKRYYGGSNDDNPLLYCLELNNTFVQLFRDFYDFVRFFMLDDLIDCNNNVKGFCGFIDFNNPFVYS